MRFVGTLELYRTMCRGPRHTEETMLALGPIVDDRAVSLGATDHLASKHELEMSKK